MICTMKFSTPTKSPKRELVRKIPSTLGKARDLRRFFIDFDITNK